MMEKLVKKKLTIDDYLSSFLIVLVALILLGVSTLIPNFYQYWLIFVALIIFACYYLIRRKSIEYEYAYFDGEFQFDKIIAKRGRKKIATIRLHDMEVFGKATESIVKQSSNKMILASSVDSLDLYYFKTNFMGKKTTFFFEPSEEMIEEITRRIPNRISKEN